MTRGLASSGFRQGPFAWSEDEVHIFMAMVAQGYLDGRASRPPQVHERDAAAVDACRVAALTCGRRAFLSAGA